VAREPDIMCGDVEEYEIEWPENQMYFVVMRKNMRLGGPRAGCTYW